MKTPPQSLEVAVEQAESSWIVRMSGAIDVDSVPVARRTFAPILEAGTTHMIVNLEAVDHVDSTGLMLLVDAFGRLSRNKRRLVLVCNNDRILRLLKITGLHKVLAAHPTEKAAMDALR